MNFYGVQFHPEVDLTENGRAILESFLRGICGFAERYTLESRVKTSVDMIRSRVGDRDVLVLVSGGVDSAVTAALLLKALPAKQVHGIHIDHGFMRKSESDLICDELRRQGLHNLLRVDAEETFLNTRLAIGGKLLPPLSEVTDPETKRLIIGNLFIQVTRTAAESLGLDFDKTFLAQGTLRPDLIESGNPEVSGYAHKIKTHHNDVDVVRRAREKGLVIETNWDWHKDEVRAVARMLGLGEEIAARQPFPGPGLAVRTLCTDGEAPVPRAEEEAFQKALAGRFPSLRGCVVPVRTVGVQGDCRSYRRLAVLWQPEGEPDFRVLYAAARDLPNSLGFMSRTAFCLNKIDVSETEVFPLHLRHNRLELLRELDARVTRALAPFGISQTFAVLLPLGSGRKKVSVAIRAFVTNDFMTGRPAAPGRDFAWAVLHDLARKIERDFPEIDLVLYDCTPKPPATVEWE
jgi:GMP synthase (glutamine-hydrolysing)